MSAGTGKGKGVGELIERERRMDEDFSCLFTTVHRPSCNNDGFPFYSPIARSV